MKYLSILSLSLLAAMAFMAQPIMAADTETAEKPEVGDDLPEIEGESMEGQDVSTKELLEEGKLVVVFLRGYPGYQCPICSRQVASLIKVSDEIEEAGASVILIYPGEVDSLEDKAEEFFKSADLPKNFHVMIDQDYEIVNAYGLRWDATRETTYPATFVANKQGKITYALISDGHGGRSDAEDVVQALNEDDE